MQVCTTVSGNTAVIASGHPEWPPIMYQTGSTINGAGPALVKKIFEDLGLTVTVPYTGTWDEVQAKAKTEVVVVTGLKREKGWDYFVDREGDVSREPET